MKRIKPTLKHIAPFLIIIYGIVLLPKLSGSNEESWLFVTMPIWFPLLFAMVLCFVGFIVIIILKKW